MIDIIIVTYGEPAGPNLNMQWEYSNRILRKLTRLVAPIPSFAVPWIGGYRAFKRWSTWKAQNYTSPFEPIAREQAKGIFRELSHLLEKGTFRVHLGYEFRDPTLWDVLESLYQSGCERLVILPMYLAVSDFTTGLSQQDFRDFQEWSGNRLADARIVTFRPCLRELAEIMAAHVRKQSEHDKAVLERTGLLLGCHGTVTVPLKGIEDTGYQDTIQAYRYLEAKLKNDFTAVDIAWLNHRRGGEWTSPTLAEAATRMRDEGIERFVYFPFGFLADNAETQLEGRTILNGLGIEAYKHIPCLNNDPAFIRFLVKLIESHLREV